MCETIVSCFEYWQDVRLPQQLQRAMAAEAEATREARAKVVAAEGEQKSSKALKEAADIISQSPSALQLRYLQVTNCVANQTRDKGIARSVLSYSGPSHVTAKYALIGTILSRDQFLIITK